MKTYFLLLLFVAGFLSAQSITVNKVVKTSDNTDKFFYFMKDTSVDKEYLGEIEVRGFSNKDQEVFSYIYKQAKQMGANAFSLKPFEAIEGGFAPFNPSHYVLNLYYVEQESEIFNQGSFFVLSSSYKPKKVDINGETVDLPSRSFIKVETIVDKPNSISTRKIFGSNIKFNLGASENSKYFEILPFQVKGNGSLTFKTGDVVGLEESYGSFLTMIYQKIK